RKSRCHTSGVGEPTYGSLLECGAAWHLPHTLGSLEPVERLWEPCTAPPPACWALRALASGATRGPWDQPSLLLLKGAGFSCQEAAEEEGPGQRQEQCQLWRGSEPWCQAQPAVRMAPPAPGPWLWACPSPGPQEPLNSQSISPAHCACRGVTGWSPALGCARPAGKLRAAAP
ncbi:hypothetical protein KIL84_016019, partial [Mauremys mutica]